MQFVAGKSRVRSDAEFRELFVLLSLPPSEDCLYLNVWSAGTTAAERRPVMVWIHGGGWVVGSPAVPGTDGTPLALKGAVLVSINYRLGPFGFATSPAIAIDAEIAADPRQPRLEACASIVSCECAEQLEEGLLCQVLCLVESRDELVRDVEDTFPIDPDERVPSGRVSLETSSNEVCL
jgi:carboxylesterase family protein